ncbi:MAG: FtsX-like permease family protein [Candidatus Heimdallarchaeota archaeon]
MSLRNNWKVALSSLRSNKKSLLLTTIGLTIALSVSFQMILFLIGSKGALLETFLTGQYDRGLFGGVISDETIAIDIGPDFEGVFYKDGYPTNDIDQIVEEDLLRIATNRNFKGFIDNSRVCSVTDITLYHTRTSTGPLVESDVTLIGLSEKDIQFLRDISPIGFPELNGTQQLIIYTLQHATNNIYVPQDFKFNISSNLAPGQVHEITLAGGIPFDFYALKNTYRPIYNQFVRRFGYSLVKVPRIIMITTLDGVGDLLEDMNIGEGLVYQKYYVNIDVDYTQYGVFSENKDYLKNTNFKNELQTNILQTTNKYFTFVYSRINYNLGLFYEDFNYIQTIILVLTFPPIAIAFFMINFSFNIVRSQNVHHINLLKARGATKKQVLYALLLEMGISTTISLILGSLLGIPLLQLIGKTSGFMEFKSDLPVANYGYTAIWLLIIIILISGITLSLIINLPRIINLSRLKVKNIAGEEERKKKPIWEVLRLDRKIGIYAVFSLIMYFIAIGFTTGETQTILILIFGVTAPVSIVVGVSLFISRIFTPAIRKLGNKLWAKGGGTFALSLKNLTHQNKQTSRAVILIVVTLSFGIVSAVVPSTIDYNTYQRWDYVLGANIVISDYLFLDEIMDYARSIDGVAGVTNIITLEETELHLGWGITTSTVIGIDPDTFLDGAFMQPLRYGFNLPFKTLIERMKNRGSIIVQRSNLRDAGLRVGDHFISNERIRYDIAGKFTYFPNAVIGKQLSTSVSSQKYIVGSMSTIMQLLNDFGTPYYNEQIYIKQEKANTGATIAAMIQEEYPSAMVTVSEDGAAGNLEMPARLSIYAMLNSSFLTTMICTIAGISIYSLLILFDRSKELAITRALGARNKEIYYSFMYETLLIMGIGIGIGLPLGIGVSAIISNIINSRNQVPPMTVDVPWLSLLIILILALGVAAISAMIPAYYTIKKEINDLARST